MSSLSLKRDYPPEVPVKRLIGSCLAMMLVAAAVPATVAAIEMNQHGLTGSWYEPATSGQGIEVEIFPDLNGPGKGYAQVSWFTYDTTVGGAERQRWYTLSGDVISGQGSAALTLYLNTGGNFNAGPVTAAQVIGTGTLRFDSCTSGQLDYSFSDGSGRSGSIPLTRLTQNMTCAASGTPPTNADFALSGNWYDPATSGQGITVEVNPASNVLFFAWYTYANNGGALGAAGQRWYTGQADYAAGARSIPLILYETIGGAFDAPTNPAPATVAVGTGTLAFQSCTSATLTFNFTGGSSSGKSGTINLARIGPVPKGCAPAVAEAKGLWRGPSASGRTITALVLEDGTYYVTYTAPGSTTVDGGLYGTSTSTGGQFSSVTGRLVELRASFVTSPAVSGTYVAQSSLALIFGVEPNTETAMLAYDATYDAPALLGTIAGSYRGYSGHRQDFYSMTATVDATGKLKTVGSPGSCNPFGTAAPHGQTGVFDITLTSACFAATLGILIYEPALSRLTALVPLHDDDMVFVTGIRQ
jgi:hypothetical protein